MDAPHRARHSRSATVDIPLPSLWEAKDGTLHLTYSNSINRLPPDAARNSIKHARLNLEWIKQGDQ